MKIKGICMCFLNRIYIRKVLSWISTKIIFNFPHMLLGSNLHMQYGDIHWALRYIGFMLAKSVN